MLCKSLWIKASAKCINVNILHRVLILIPDMSVLSSHNFQDQVILVSSEESNPIQIGSWNCWYIAFSQGSHLF